MDRYFQIHYGSSDSNIGSIRAGVPRGSILSPISYNIFTSDQPITSNTIVADYADDKVITSTNAYLLIASVDLQNHLFLMEDWYIK